ncbi:MAG: phospho-sugar mutase [Lachnospiraceae bacterium]|nr:phospho-sugar mutase [Lachnospiraceae bacterium]
MNSKQMYEFWCNDPGFDEKTREELKGIAGNQEEIEDRFYKNLEFGTGGLRGIMGAGTNRMNRYTVRRATQGLANYIKKEGTEKKGIAIAYDSRNHSREFAQEAALCMAANGIPAYSFPSLRPTPMLSFALRELGCTAGVVITASHNPSEYNGYKVYWEDGAQITFPRDQAIIGEVNRVEIKEARTMGLSEAKGAGLWREIGSEIDDRYFAALKSLVLHPETAKEQGQKMKIVYTPLHGTGNLPVRRILKELGFENVYVVKEQELPDGNFPTVDYPNPEDPNAFALAVKLAEEVDADLVLATDPDADRLGIYVKEESGASYRRFTGNMLGMVILEYLLSQRKDLGRLPEDGAVVTTIVSGKMAKRIADAYGVSLIETLTGFKYIGEQIKFFEQDHEHTFLFGYEESYGCLEGVHSRDKDAVVAVMALCEAAAYYRSWNVSLDRQMENLFEKYGYYEEDMCTITRKGANGAREISAMMEHIRTHIPTSIGGFSVRAFRDYDAGIIRESGSEKTVLSGLPKSNVLYFDLEDDGWCCVRPSGTEPKIKFYGGVRGTDHLDAKEKLQRLLSGMRSLEENKNL